MNEREIHEAIEGRDLNRVWTLMMQRTEWIQNSEFSQEEAKQIAQDTIAIREQLLAVQESIGKEIERSTQTNRAIRAYVGWEGAK